MSGGAWYDLIQGLTLLSAHPTDENSPLHCEHDELWVMADPEKFTQEEIDQLDELGFFPNDGDGDSFKSYRFGSA